MGLESIATHKTVSVTLTDVFYSYLGTIATIDYVYGQEKISTMKSSEIVR